MRQAAGAARLEPGQAVPAGLAALALLALAVGFVGGVPFETSATVALVSVALALAGRRLLEWSSLIVALALVILFVPIRRYTLPGDLPFELEPYRILVAFLVGGWVASLLADQRTRLRRSGLEGPVLLFALVALASVVANGRRITAGGLETDVVKSLSFVATFFLVFYLIVGVVRSIAEVELIVRVLVLGGVAVALLAVLESRTGVNYFNQLSRVAPFLQPHVVLDELGRGARLRAYASAQHPIALGAALVMLVPLALYLAHRQARWLIAAGVLLTGAVSTVSRTPVLMLAVVALVFLWLRPAETKRAWPVLVPIVVAIHFVTPGTLGSLKGAFFPKQGLIAEQRGRGDTGRIGDIRPTLGEWAAQPILGQGYGTRIPVGPRKNARILDNQWLRTLAETGLVGVIALAWLFIRFIRRTGRAAKDDSASGWLLVALTASVTAFAVGMLTFDAFSFVQATFLLFFMLGLATVVLRERDEPASGLGRPAGLAEPAR